MNRTDTAASDETASAPAAQKKPRFFLRDVDSGEPAWHCGDTPREAAAGIRALVEPIIESMLIDPELEPYELQIEMSYMTDQEVADLPDC